MQTNRSLFCMNEKYQSPFVPEAYYHVYARSNGGAVLFRTDDNRYFFLLKFNKYISPIATVHAYCLMDNHVHFLLQLRSHHELVNHLNIRDNEELNAAISQTFRRLFISYSTSYNDRKGSLFQRPFRRIMVDTEAYFTALVAYIHCNPTKHLQQDYTSWKWSSYRSLLSKKPTKLARTAVIDWFGGSEAFVTFHQNYREAYLDEMCWLE